MNEQEIIVGKKRYVFDSALDELAKQVIEKNAMEDMDKPRITYMKVYPNVTKTVAGRCIRASDTLKIFSDCDYIIQMSGDLWDKLNASAREVLMHHELLHVAVKYDKDGNEKFLLRKHDIEDFAEIVGQYGINWLHDLRNEAAVINPNVDVLKIRI